MAEEKIYCGNGKIVNTKFGDIMKISFHRDDLTRLLNNLSNDWVNCDLKEKKDPVPGKSTHYLQIDNWKPDPNRQSASTSPAQNNYNPPRQENDASFDLPF